MGKCVVLISDSGYSDAYQPRLRELLDDGIDLFCAVGSRCETWEDAMDWLCVELDANGTLPGAFCNTTSHPNETVDEVLEFARNWNRLKGEEPDVRVINL